MANLFEILSKPFLRDEQKENDVELSSEPSKDDVIKDFNDFSPTGFYDDGADGLWAFNELKKKQTADKQNDLIKMYRKIAMTPEVSDAKNEIIDEAIFSPGDSKYLDLIFNTDIPQNLQDAIQEEFNYILTRLNLHKNIYTLFDMFYVDGQLNIHCAYDEDDKEKGIVSFKILSPFNLIYNYDTKLWEYVETFEGNQKRGSKIFSEEEIIRIDSGIYDDNLILSNLHTAIKPANQLSTLEDMLIPMRYSRSVSRRVFNVDVSKLNNKKAEEYMGKIKNKFKFKKFYNVNDGTISNQQHIAALTEDYWFPNRDGAKGTQVDTLDESGNLGELGDILYFKRKLYTALKVPIDRINDEGDSGATFDFTDTSVSREEVKFFNFISRLRNLFLELVYGILKRQLIFKGTITLEEWDDIIKDGLNIRFTTENIFFEKLKKDKLNSSLELFTNIEELIGTYFSYEYVYKNVLDLNDEEIDEMHKQIEKEKSDNKYKRFFETDDDM